MQSTSGSDETLSLLDATGQLCYIPVQSYDRPVEACPRAMQVGGFVIGKDNCVNALRWIPARGDVLLLNPQNLRCHISAATVPFLQPYIQNTLDATATGDHGGIVLYILNGSARYHGGRYRIKHWSCTEEGNAEVILERDVDPHTRDRDSKVPCMRDRWIAWGVDCVEERVIFPLGADKCLVASYLLYDILSESLLKLLRPANRFGPHCVVQEHTQYPSMTCIQLARQFAIHYRLPLVLLLRHESVEDACLWGLQCIFFQPGSGEDQRVHFGRNDADKLCLLPGEFGDIV